MTLTEAPAGFLNIHKPRGPTSHDIITRLRRITGIRRIGHTGTLDPLATGVLPICVGRATRLSEYLLGADKRYRAWLRLGESTSTYDTEGEITSIADASHITRDDVLSTLSQFHGQIEQTVPKYSAIKRGGRKLYELARAGKNFTPPSRSVRIHELTLLTWQPPELELETLCSAGTYIRSLAHDLGMALDVGAHIVSLERVTSGRFQIMDGIRPAVLEGISDWRTHLLPPEWPFADWLKLSLNATEAAAVRNGQSIVSEQAIAKGELALAMSAGQLIAVVRALDSSWKPIKVLLPATQNSDNGSIPSRFG